MIIYDQIFLYIDGALAAENISIETGLTADHQDALTTVKGFAGYTPAPAMRTVKATFLVPDSGFEFDYEGKFVQNKFVEMALQSGATGKKMKSKGYFKNVDISSGVGKTTEVSFDFAGEPAVFQ